MELVPSERQMNWEDWRRAGSAKEMHLRLFLFGPCSSLFPRLRLTLRASSPSKNACTRSQYASHSRPL